MSGAGSINLTNQFLIAMPGMADETFSGAVVYLCEHTDKGALGLVINRPIELNLRGLFERVELPFHRDDIAEQPVYYGGPVQTERGFVLHDRLGPEGGHYASTLTVPDGLEMTASRDVLEAIAQGAGPRRALVMLGYAGWGAGQLEDELARNGWLTVGANADVIFDTPIEARYERALGLLGIHSSMLSQDVGHA